MIAASYLIAEALGQRYVDGNPLSMERVLEESGTARPVICLLSPGKETAYFLKSMLDWEPYCLPWVAASVE